MELIAEKEPIETPVTHREASRTRRQRRAAAPARRRRSHRSIALFPPGFADQIASSSPQKRPRACAGVVGRGAAAVSVGAWEGRPVSLQNDASDGAAPIDIGGEANRPVE